MSVDNTKKPAFNADAAEEYFSDLLTCYRKTANDIFRRDNEGRHYSNQTYSAEYQKYVGMQIAMREVLEYFSKYDLGECAKKELGDLDRLRELVEADRDGRCVVLPCKVGDIVYTNMSIRGDKYKMADRPYPVKVVFVGMGDGKSYFHVKYDNGRCFPFDFDQIGKTVFLTREAAAAALKGGQDA